MLQVITETNGGERRRWASAAVVLLVVQYFLSTEWVQFGKGWQIAATGSFY
jgi:hypothetical protein